MQLLTLLANCLGITEHNNHPLDAPEKPCNHSPVRSAEEISDAVVELLRTAEKDGPTLKRQISDAVGDQGWTESIARAIVAGLEALVKQGRATIGSVLTEFIHKAEDATNSVFDFPDEHPYLTAGFATIVAIGVLVLVAPWVVEALGFAELGPVTGKQGPWILSAFYILMG